MSHEKRTAWYIASKLPVPASPMGCGWETRYAEMLDGTTVADDGFSIDEGTVLPGIRFSPGPLHAIRTSSPLPQQPIGENTEHRFVHLQQQMHFSLSTAGAAKPICEMAPTGQCCKVGHGWFWGQSSFRMTIIKSFCERGGPDRNHVDAGPSAVSIFTSSIYILYSVRTTEVLSSASDFPAFCTHGIRSFPTSRHFNHPFQFQAHLLRDRDEIGIADRLHRR